MSQKEAKVNSHLHSIPILLKGYSIPLVCMAALLLLICNMFVICGVGSSDNTVYAADSPSAATSLSIVNSSLSTTVAPGEVGYVSSNVTYSAMDVTSYTLQVTYASGQSALKLSGGTTTLAGAASKTPANMADNSWGFAWGATSVANDSLTYYTMPTYGTNGTGVSTGRLENGTADIASTTKKIVFAAKFGTNNTNNGHYSTAVLLSLIATPKQVYTLTYDANNGTGAPASQTCKTTSTSSSCSITISSTKPTRSGYIFQGWGDSSGTTTVSWAADGSIPMTADKIIYAVWKADGPAVTGFGGIKKMQDMTSTVCTNASGSGQLYDTRDESTYTIQKLSDNKCWMTQNLRIVDKAITSADSNVNAGANYTIPASALWSDTAATTNKAYYNNNTTYGAYYTYYTATAGTNPSSGDASYDICPKNWRLPTKAEYDTLKGKGTAKAGTWSNNSTTSGYWIGGVANASTAAFWYAAGYVYSGSLSDAGTYGVYWSSTVVNSSGYAHRLRFGSSDMPSTDGSDKYYGFSVRCVAK